MNIRGVVNTKYLNMPHIKTNSSLKYTIKVYLDFDHLIFRSPDALS